MRASKGPEGRRSAPTYLNLAQIAESFGVAERVVEGWIRNEQLPHTRDAGRLLFERDRVAHWATSRGFAARTGFLGLEGPALETGCRLEPMLRAGGIWRDVGAAGASGVADILDRVVAALPGATPPIRDLLAKRLRSPGGLTMAPIGGGLALPHPSARVSLGRRSSTLALLCLRDPVPLPVPPADGEPLVRLFFFIAPSPRVHLEVLGRLSRALTRGPLRALVAAGAEDEAIFRAVVAADVAASSPVDPVAAP